MSKMMRVSENTSNNLNYLTKITGETKQQLIDEAIELLLRKKFFKKAAQADEELAKDPKAWKTYLKEHQEWDSTNLDGLEEEE